MAGRPAASNRTSYLTSRPERPLTLFGMNYAWRRDLVSTIEYIRCPVLLLRRIADQIDGEPMADDRARCLRRLIAHGALPNRGGVIAPRSS